jgi:hypothetical protein
MKMTKEEMKNKAGTHAQESAHWTGVAKSCGQKAKIHAGMGDGEGDDHMKLAACYEKDQMQAEAHAAWHASQAEKCTKAAATDDLEKRDDRIVPDGVSKVTPNAPGITMVPRAGQRVAAAVPLAPQFQKLVEVEDGEEQSLLLR